MDPVKIVLFVEILVILFVWGATSYSSLHERINSAFTVRGLIFTGLNLLFILQILGFITIPFPKTPYDTKLEYIGLGISLAGVFFAIWAKLSMGKNWGVPAQHNLKKQKNLVSTGPFSYSRNPIYVGLLWTVIGIELALKSWLILIVIPLLYLIDKAISKEEQLLNKFFGKKYMEYKKRAPRYL